MGIEDTMNTLFFTAACLGLILVLIPGSSAQTKGISCFQCSSYTKDEGCNDNSKCTRGETMCYVGIQNTTAGIKYQSGCAYQDPTGCTCEGCDSFQTEEKQCCGVDGCNGKFVPINPTPSPTDNSDYDNSVEEGAATGDDPNSAVMFSISAVYVAIIALVL